MYENLGERYCQVGLTKFALCSFCADLPTWLDAGVASSFNAMGSTKTTAQVYPFAYTNALMNAAIEAGAKVEH